MLTLVNFNFLCSRIELGRQRQTQNCAKNDGTKKRRFVNYNNPSFENFPEE